jgi:sodium-dependent dicarboxylate transporter 2/3/5
MDRLSTTGGSSTMANVNSPLDWDVRIDTRPLRTILFERAGAPAVIAVAAVLFAVLITRTPPEGLDDRGLAALAVFTVAILLWVTSALPLMVTSLLVFILLPATGVVSAKQAYNLFGSEALFFILGVVILAACLFRSGLSTRIALAMLRRFGHTPRALLVTVYLVNGVMSFFMSEHAVAAMNFPIVMEIIRVLGLRPRESTYARALVLAMAWGTTLGGVATLLGGARAPLALGIVREATGANLTFTEWALANLPAVVVMLAIGYAVIEWFFPIDVPSIRAADEMIERRSFELGRLSTREKLVGGVWLLTLAGWILGGEQFGLATVALTAVVAMFTIRVVVWNDVERHISWGILLMYGGAIALGTAMNDSGASKWIAHQTIAAWAETPVTAVLIVSALSILLTEAMSNSAVVAMLMPITLGVASDLGMDPRVMALVVAVPAGLSFMLPTGTPANAIAYASGFITLRDMVVPGAILNVAAWVVFNAMSVWWWPVLGIVIDTR